MSVQPEQITLQENIIQELKEEPNFLAVRYNEQTKSKSSRGGGAYVPPHKLRAMQQKIMEEDPASVDHQRMMWELLRKSINGIVNKVNISNIQNIVIELFNENILRGMGLLSKAIIKAQMTSPNFTHVYAALIAVINTKLPEIGSLIATRAMIMYKRSFSRNNRIVCIAAAKMIAHLINQKVLGEYAGLQIIMILLMNVSQDSVEIACDFMTEVGQVLSEVSPASVSVIFERFKNLLHEGEIEQKSQYSIEKLFAVRKTGFKNHQGVIAELDLVEAEDQITHNIDYDDELNGQENLNFFKEDPNYLENEEEWDKIKLEILGEENIINLKHVEEYEEEVEEYNQIEEEHGIKDLTEQDLINLRRTIYLAIQSTVNFEECAHKIIKMNITKGYESELIDMILECCMMERIYQSFFGLLSERFCKIDDIYKELFIQAFVNYYNTVFKMEVNKIRNLAKLYGHLFYTFSIDWKIMQVITLRQDTTTSAHRMFLKIMFREIAENLGIEKLATEFANEEMRDFYSGLFPIGHPTDVRFAINYWTSIGLGRLTEEMREVLDLQEQLIAEKKNREEQEKIEQLMREEKEMLEMLEDEELEREEQERKERTQKEEEERIKTEAKIKKEEEQRIQRNRKQERQETDRRDRQKSPRYRPRERSREKEPRQNIRKPSSDSDSRSSSSSSSSSEETPKVVVKKPVEVKVQHSGKNSERNRVESSNSSESESSGIESDSDSASEENKRGIETVKNSQKKPQEKKRKASESSSSSESSSQGIRKRKSSERSRRKEAQRKRHESSSSSSSSSLNRKRRRSPERERRKR